MKKIAGLTGAVAVLLLCVTLVHCGPSKEEVAIADSRHLTLLLSWERDCGRTAALQTRVWRTDSPDTGALRDR